MKNRFALTLVIVPTLVGMSLFNVVRGNAFGACYCSGAAAMIVLWIILDLVNKVDTLLPSPKDEE